LADNGIPEILLMLVTYFQAKYEMISQVGIFRKSGAINEEKKL